MDKVEYFGKPRHHRKHHFKLAIIIFFSIVFLSLILTSFFGANLTGNVVKSLSGNSSEGIKFSARLNVPDLELNGEFDSIKIAGSSDSFFYVGGQKFPLTNKNSRVEIKGYDGRISFNSKNIYEMKGKAKEVLVNGVPVLPAKETMKISIDEELDYATLTIDEGVFIDELNYETSGSIILDEGKNVFNLAGDEILIKNFLGSLSVENKKLFISGELDSFEVFGETEVYVSS